MLLTDSAAFWTAFNKDNPAVVFMDTETTGLDPHRDKLLLLQLYWPGAERAILFDCRHTPQEQLVEVVQAISACTVVAHNMAFDWKMLYANTGVWLNKVYCSLIAERLIFPEKRIPADLKNVVLRYTGETLDKDIRDLFLTETEISQEMLDYAAKDVYVLEEVYFKQQRALADLKLERVAYEIEMPCVPYTAMMEYIGMAVDVEQLAAANVYYAQLVKERCLRLNDLAARKFISNGKLSNLYLDSTGTYVFNAASPVQLIPTLAEYGIETKSMSKDILPELDRIWEEEQISVEKSGAYANPFIELYTQYNKPLSILTDFIRKLPRFVHSKTGAIHTNFKQMGTDTGRYSSSNPNIQNTPKLEDLEAIGVPVEMGVRSMFIARPGYKFVISDYAGLEMVILALLSKDKALLEAIDPKNDMHVLAANIFFNIDIPLAEKKKNPWKTYRNVAKTVNYSIIYGTTAHTILGKNAGPLKSVGYLLTMERAEDILFQWKTALFPDAGAWLEKQTRQGMNTLEARTVTGRLRRWQGNPPDVYIEKSREWNPGASKERIFSKAKARWLRKVGRESTNSPIQGAAADLTKQATSIVGDLLRIKYDYDNAHILAQVHDELVVEVREEYAEEVAALVQWAMEEAGRRIFPFAPEGAIRASSQISVRYDK